MHVAVWEFYNGKVPKGFHVHHIDENTFNNEIINLKIIEAKEHLIIHGKKRFVENPTFAKSFQEKGIAVAPLWHKSNEGIDWHKKHAESFGFGVFDLPERNCNQCNTKYKPKTKRSKFCNNNCKAKYRRSIGVDKVERKCTECQKTFITDKYSKTKTCRCKGRWVMG